jgi:hypothetical protein
MLAASSSIVVVVTALCIYLWEKISFFAAAATKIRPKLIGQVASVTDEMLQ